MSLFIHKEFNHAEIAYWIGKKYWNKGYCTEAAKALLNYAFNELNLNRIIANYISRNLSSGRVMEKLGMKKEGILRQHVIKWKKYEDLIAYGILKKEWEESN